VHRLRLGACLQRITSEESQAESERLQHSQTEEPDEEQQHAPRLLLSAVGELAEHEAYA